MHNIYKDTHNLYLFAFTLYSYSQWYIRKRNNKCPFCLYVLVFTFLFLIIRHNGDIGRYFLTIFVTREMIDRYAIFTNESPLPDGTLHPTVRPRNFPGCAECNRLVYADDICERYEILSCKISLSYDRVCQLGEGTNGRAASRSSSK